MVIGIPLIAAPTDDEAGNTSPAATTSGCSASSPATGAGCSRRSRTSWPACAPEERAAIGDFLAAAVIGGPGGSSMTALSRLAEDHGADEFMLVCDIFDPELRLRPRHRRRRDEGLSPRSRPQARPRVRQGAAPSPPRRPFSRLHHGFHHVFPACSAARRFWRRPAVPPDGLRPGSRRGPQARRAAPSGGAFTPTSSPAAATASTWS